jgi:hypothetical protein
MVDHDYMSMSHTEKCEACRRLYDIFMKAGDAKNALVRDRNRWIDLYNKAVRERDEARDGEKEALEGEHRMSMLQETTQKAGDLAASMLAQRDRRIAELEAALSAAKPYVERVALACSHVYTGECTGACPVHSRVAAALERATLNHGTTCTTLNWCGNHLTPIEWSRFERMHTAAQRLWELHNDPDPTKRALWEGDRWKAFGEALDALDAGSGVGND